jgi:hypothetical protein
LRANLSSINAPDHYQEINQLDLLPAADRRGEPAAKRAVFPGGKTKQSYLALLNLHTKHNFLAYLDNGTQSRKN